MVLVVAQTHVGGVHLLHQVDHAAEHQAVDDGPHVHQHGDKHALALVGRGNIAEAERGDHGHGKVERRCGWWALFHACCERAGWYV